MLTLPSSSFPNGLAFHDGYLYVSDSGLGAIWRVQPDGENPSAPWYEDALLAPSKSIGANGIAFDATGSNLYVAVADSGRLVRLTLAGDGNVSGANVVLRSKQLNSVDGIAFDSGGVASGPMASTFILSLTLGASVSSGGDPATDGFGVIAWHNPNTTVLGNGTGIDHLDDSGIFPALMSAAEACGITIPSDG